MNKFEQFIQNSPDYINLCFQYGNQLFIQENGVYKIQAVRLAKEIFDAQQFEIADLKNKAECHHKAFVFMDECRMAWHQAYMRLKEEKLNAKLKGGL